MGSKQQGPAINKTSSKGFSYQIRQIALLVQKTRLYFSTSRTFWLYILAGVISGIPQTYLGVYQSNSEAEAIGNFAAQWFPGLIFGFVFGQAQLWPSHTTLSFASISAMIYYLAVQIALGYVTNFGVAFFGLPGFKEYAIAGILAGGFGALTLSWTGKLFTDVKRTAKQEAVTALLGAVMGAIFVLLVTQPSNVGMPVDPTALDQLGVFLKRSLIVCMAYATWQGSVGLRLSRDIVYSERLAANGEFSEKLSKFLQGPVVQLIGLIGSLLGILSLINSGS